MEEKQVINKFMGVTEQSYQLLTHLSDIDYKQWNNLMPVVEKILSEIYEDTGIYKGAGYIDVTKYPTNPPTPHKQGGK